VHVGPQGLQGGLRAIEGAEREPEDQLDLALIGEGQGGEEIFIYEI